MLDWQVPAPSQVSARSQVLSAGLPQGVAAATRFDWHVPAPSQVSAWLHAESLGSPHAVPAAVRCCWQVPAPSQVSAGLQVESVGSPHSSPADLSASAGQVVSAPSQVSARSQSPAAARQMVPTGLIGCVQAPSLSQMSRVQGRSSGGQGVPAAAMVTLGGQAVLTPSQSSTASQSEAAGRQTVFSGATASSGQSAPVPE